MAYKVLLVGAAGRMGQNLLKCIAEHPDLTLAYALVQEGAPQDGQPVPFFPDQTYLSDIDYCRNFDLAIDFSSVESTLETINHCLSLEKALLIGTTGFNPEQVEVIKQAAQKIPVVFAANYSVGMNLMFKLVEKAAAVMHNSDIEIIEAHHNKKVDAPSGTALALGRHICHSLGVDLEEVAVKERNGIIGPRTKQEIGFSTIRAADVVGEHTVWFADVGERIELTHRVSERITFARGATRAAAWLANQGQAGLFDMTHVLGLDKF